jgi:hypothetical protein
VWHGAGVADRPDGAEPPGTSVHALVARTPQQVLVCPIDRGLPTAGANVGRRDDPHLHRVLAVGVHDLSECVRRTFRSVASRVLARDRDPPFAPRVAHLDVEASVRPAVAWIPGQPTALVSVDRQERGRQRIQRSLPARGGPLLDSDGNCRSPPPEAPTQASTIARATACTRPTPRAGRPAQVIWPPTPGQPPAPGRAGCARTGRPSRPRPRRRRTASSSRSERRPRRRCRECSWRADRPRLPPHP